MNQPDKETIALFCEFIENSMIPDYIAGKVEANPITLEVYEWLKSLAEAKNA